MKKVILNRENCETISINEAVQKMNNPIICYITSSGKGLAILQDPKPKQELYKYGFCYHSYLVTGTNNNLKFEGNSRRSCINQAIHFNRKVLVFDSFEEFLEFSSKYYNDYSEHNEC